MNEYLSVYPWNRVNDQWLSPDINAKSINCDYRNPLIKNTSHAASRDRFQPDFYKSFALDIVAESVYNYPYPYVSEKTLRPIACKRMFIVVGAPNVLALLRKKGFQTFSDVIDESYDSVADPIKRWYAICDAISCFVQQPLEKIKEILESQKYTLEHNFLTLQNLEAQELSLLEKSLYDQI